MLRDHGVLCHLFGYDEESDVSEYRTQMQKIDDGVCVRCFLVVGMSLRTIFLPLFVSFLHHQCQCVPAHEHVKNARILRVS